MTSTLSYPYTRSRLMRTVYIRLKDDEKHRNSKHTYWYDVDLNRIPDDLHLKFYQLYQDDETEEFLEICYEKADWIFTQIWNALVRSLLSWFMSNTSINGYLKRGSMFVYSQAQFQKLLGIDDSWLSENLIDLGAGDGMVTKKMASHFKNVFVTEVSHQMQYRLAENGFTVIDIENWANGHLIYDVISCLNLLDRCNYPLNILKQIKATLRPETGRLVVALVLPFSAYVEENSVDHKPAEKLGIQGNTFEDQTTDMINNVFKPLGFELVTFSRVPYLSEGDLSTSFYVLHDAIFVLKVANNTTQSC